MTSRLTLFDDPQQPASCTAFAPDAVLLRGFASDLAPTLLTAIETICQAAPPRHMTTPGGRAMSVLNTNCGPLGWVSSTRGYAYAPCNPATGAAWPAMPDSLLELTRDAARTAGFGAFTPDACLINIYTPGTRMGLHQDKDETDFSAPIVSISLGLPATFLFGGDKRTDKPQRLALLHGDVVVWGGASRLAFHGIAPIREGVHPATGRRRINLTLRKAR